MELARYLTGAAQMFFLISGRKYEVVIVNNLVRGGELRESWFDPERHQILINSSVPADRRRAKLFHELSHAWSALHGLAGDEESQAQRDETFIDTMTEQFEVQGGSVALQAMIAPPEAHRLQQLIGSYTLTHRECGACSAPVMCGSFCNSEPVFVEAAGQRAMDRMMQCEACGAWTTWREFCDDEGAPTGRLSPHPQPRVLSGREAARWFEEHQGVMA